MSITWISCLLNNKERITLIDWHGPSFLFDMNTNQYFDANCIVVLGLELYLVIAYDTKVKNRLMDKMNA